MENMMENTMENSPETDTANVCVEETETKNPSKHFWTNNTGMGTVEIILIIVVLIALVLIFKTQLTSLVKTVFENISDGAAGIMET